LVSFKTTKTTGQALVKNLKELLASYRLNNKTISHVKDEGET